MVNEALVKPKELDYKNDLIEVDYTFVDEGIYVTNDYISFVLDGTFSPA